MKRINKDEMSLIDKAVKEGLSDDDNKQVKEEDRGGIPGKKGTLVRIKMEHDELKDKILKIDTVLINHINVSPSQYDYLKIQRDAMMTVYHVLELRISDLANEISSYEIH